MIISLIKTISSNRKLPLKPLRKLFAPMIGALSALLNAFFSPVITIAETRLAVRARRRNLLATNRW